MILGQFLFLFSLGALHGLDVKADGAVGADALASAAGDAAVAAIGVINEFEAGAEALGPFVGVAVFGIEFGDFGSDELRTGHLQALNEAHDARAERFKIF